MFFFSSFTSFIIFSLIVVCVILSLIIYFYMPSSLSRLSEVYKDSIYFSNSPDLKEGTYKIKNVESNLVYDAVRGMVEEDQLVDNQSWFYNPETMQIINIATSKAMTTSTDPESFLVSSDLIESSPVPINQKFIPKLNTDGKTYRISCTRLGVPSYVSNGNPLYGSVLSLYATPRKQEYIKYQNFEFIPLDVNDFDF